MPGYQPDGGEDIAQGHNDFARCKYGVPLSLLPRLPLPLLLLQGWQGGVVSIALAAAIPLVLLVVYGGVYGFRFRVADAIACRLAIAPATAADILRLAVPLQLCRLATGAEPKVSPRRHSSRVGVFSFGSLRRLLNVSQVLQSILATLNYLWPFPTPPLSAHNICIASSIV